MTAIKQYSTLGSGFKIAMRDLEIRGAGNLLGSEQSGHITAIGFDLYCQLLKQSVGALKGEKVKPRVELRLQLDFIALHPGEETRAPAKPRSSRAPTDELEINVPREVATFESYDDDTVAEKNATPDPIPTGPAYLPLKYILEPQQRIEIYRKLAQATDKAAVTALRTEMLDRFGPLPAPVELLLLVTELKILASERGITALETRDDRLMLTRNRDLITIGNKFPRLTKRDPKASLNEIRKLLLAL
jgi:transcription-repair coupling factor (superfamily II helicase)